ncbi:MAG: hypothetical protein HPY75_15030 [Actinobacteria bacterium]|nr:hypothetical protein [Actinomycetota bacterium]
MIRRASMGEISDLSSENGASEKEKKEVEKAIKETLRKFGPNGTLKHKVKY